MRHWHRTVWAWGSYACEEESLCTLEATQSVRPGLCRSTARLLLQGAVTQTETAKGGGWPGLGHFVLRPLSLAGWKVAGLVFLEAKALKPKS